MKLLVVDDDALVRRALARMLRRAGHDVRDAADAESALGLVDELDALITDLWMPGVDGLQLAAAVGRTRPDLPIVLVTALPHPDLDERAAEVGVTAVLRKPVEPEELRRVLAELNS